MSDDLGPPDLTNSFTEAARATTEFWAYLAALPGLSNTTASGKGQPVLVLPGLAAGDMTTAPLRRFLNDRGYTVYGWAAGINRGPNEQTVTHLKKKLEEISKLHEGQKVTLIGHSLGGLYAREMAKAFPSKVERVITLGSPFGAGVNQDIAVRMLRPIFARLSGGASKILNDEAFQRQLIIPPRVPTTSIYSRSDGIVNWKACINAKSKRTENIEISSSHLGMIIHPTALAAIANRMAQPANDWQPFRLGDYKTGTFPSPQAHEQYPVTISREIRRAPKYTLFD